MAPDEVEGMQAGVISGRLQTVLAGARNDLYNRTIVSAIALVITVNFILAAIKRIYI